MDMKSLFLRADSSVDGWAESQLERLLLSPDMCLF
jgi:hypothetical protein